MTAVTNQKNEAAEKKTTKRASAKTAAPKAEKAPAKKTVKEHCIFTMNEICKDFEVFPLILTQSENLLQI